MMLTLTRNNRNMISPSAPVPSLLLFAFISIWGVTPAVVVVEIVAKVCCVETTGDK